MIFKINEDVSKYLKTNFKIKNTDIQSYIIFMIDLMLKYMLQ